MAPQKAHRASRTNPKKSKSTGTGGKKNAVAKPGAFARRIRLSADRSEKRAANPTLPVDRTGGDLAPRVVAVVGPKGVGKSTIIRNLVKHYSKRNVPSVTGPITIVGGRKKRITFLEVGPDLSSMIDAAKVADLVLLVIDASYGFEMETFEFLNIAAAHGMPKVMAILTHLDSLRDGKQVRSVKKSLKDRIWAELYDGAKVFYLSGITTSGDYLNREILNLSRFISVGKSAGLKWRAEHPYVLADRVEDITPSSLPDHANRSVAVYGYVRGTPLRAAAGQWRVHLAGVGDLVACNIESLPDPCPAPETKTDADNNGKLASTDSSKRKRRVSERERMVYAPMAPEVDGISYDRDAVYINLASQSVRFSDKATLVSEGMDGDHGQSGDESSDGEGEKMVKSLQKSDGRAVDEKLKQASLQLVKDGKRIVSQQFSQERNRRRVEFDGEDGGEISSESSDSESSSSNSESSRDCESSSSDEDNITASRQTPRTGATASIDKDHEDSSREDEGDSSEEDGSDIDEDAIESTGDTGLIEEDSSSDAEDEATARRWKENMLESAAEGLRKSANPSRALEKFVYKKDGNGQYAETGGSSSAAKLAEGSADDDSEDDTFFTPRRQRRIASSNGDMNRFPDSVLDDITRRLPEAVAEWISDESLCAKLKRKRFGTGRDLAEEGDMGQPDEDQVLDGDFEDLETGETHRGENLDDEDADIEALKTEKKKAFDAAWDQKDGEHQGENAEGTHPDEGSRKNTRDALMRTPDPRKVERERLDKMKQDELHGLDEETRMMLEGILPGKYVRMELQDVPVEFVKFFDPKYPIVVGGLKPSDDEGATFVRTRIRRHRFKRGVLKSTDPVVFSVGWRRFQSIPVYDVEDQGGRRRYLKYTPEYLHCNATFWAPSVAPGTGVVLCQSLGRDKGGFRIAGTGVVTEVSSSFNVVKKLKLIGEPLRVHKNTAFIKGMFNSELEASKYVGASIRTVSGIRGTIKKSISEAAQRGALDREIGKSPAGTFRAGFEDKILLSDVVFLRAWVPVEAPKFCSIATTLLDKERTGDGAWRMRTIREVREEKRLPIPRQKDSLYSPVERARPVFMPLKLTKKLEGSLPYASKPKNFASKTKKKPQSARQAAIASERAVVLEKKERQEHKLLQAVYTIRNERNKKRKEANSRSLERKKKGQEKEEQKREMHRSERRKRKFAMEGARDARDAKRRREGE